MTNIKYAIFFNLDEVSMECRIIMFDKNDRKIIPFKSKGAKANICGNENLF